ncbi:hypothetical protein F4779DRAFT_251330 [Xylariaceae sp. FL0662B]|nr:hypothetical protein F4779DRAFT_251330 [Xylariaceae sp. FL0662B]
MLPLHFRAAVVALWLLSSVGLAIPPSCPNIPPASYSFKVAPGWAAVKVLDGLTSPRGLTIDAKGRLLIAEEGAGVSQHTVDVNGCITSSRMLVPTTDLNHGTYLSIDERTLFASSATSVFSWAYDLETGNVAGLPLTMISGMANAGHRTRTLIIPPNHPDLLVVSHGSGSNLDYSAIAPETARAIVKVFNISTVPQDGYDYVADGWNAGYGLRNEVGLVFDGNNMLWGVENSADELTRDVDGISTDIHIDNPAEELNYLGDVSVPNNHWYGYPTCFTVWRPDAIVDREFQVGEQFVVAPNDTFNDFTCTQRSVPSRLSFQAHSAPLDGKFDSSYSNLFVSLHGSWNRQPPTGYKIVAVPFTKDSDEAYTPVALASSTSGYIDVFYPPDESKCSASSCARPVGLAFDSVGRLYMTSDTSGELFLLEGGN